MQPWRMRIKDIESAHHCLTLDGEEYMAQLPHHHHTGFSFPLCTNAGLCSCRPAFAPSLMQLALGATNLIRLAFASSHSNVWLRSKARKGLSGAFRMLKWPPVAVTTSRTTTETGCNGKEMKIVCDNHSSRDRMILRASQAKVFHLCRRSSKIGMISSTRGGIEHCVLAATRSII